MLGMALTGTGQGTYLATNLALVADVRPGREVHTARNLGILNTANVLPQSLMPAIAPGILFAQRWELCRPVRDGGDAGRAERVGHPTGARGALRQPAHQA